MTKNTYLSGNAPLIHRPRNVGGAILHLTSKYPFQPSQRPDAKSFIK